MRLHSSLIHALLAGSQANRNFAPAVDAQRHKLLTERWLRAILVITPLKHRRVRHLKLAKHQLLTVPKAEETPCKPGTPSCPELVV